MIVDHDKIENGSFKPRRFQRVAFEFDFGCSVLYATWPLHVLVRAALNISAMIPKTVYWLATHNIKGERVQG